MRNIELRNTTHIVVPAPLTIYITLQVLPKIDCDRSSHILKFNLPYAALVQIKLFDCFGNELETVFHDWKNSGTHVIERSIDYLPKGKYVYHLKTNYDSTLKILSIA